MREARTTGNGTVMPATYRRKKPPVPSESVPENFVLCGRNRKTRNGDVVLREGCCWTPADYSIGKSARDLDKQHPELAPHFIATPVWKPTGKIQREYRSGSQTKWETETLKQS